MLYTPMINDKMAYEKIILNNMANK